MNSVCPTIIATSDVRLSTLKNSPQAVQWFQSATTVRRFFEERHPEILRESIWELILSDANFAYPNHRGEVITVQDCWRSKENFAEQAAVRKILQRMNFEVVELPENHAQTKFCGYSLYQPQPPRNPALAPKRFLHGAQGLFQPHTRTHASTLRTNSHGQSRGLLSLLRARLETGRREGIPFGGTFIRGGWTPLI